MGNCFSLQKDHEAALKYFQRALQLDQYFTYAHTLCGHEYVCWSLLLRIYYAFSLFFHSLIMYWLIMIEHWCNFFAYQSCISCIYKHATLDSVWMCMCINKCICMYACLHLYVYIYICVGFIWKLYIPQQSFLKHPTKFLKWEYCTKSCIFGW